MGKYLKRKVVYFLNGRVSKKENNIFSHHNVQATSWFHGSDYLETSKAWITHLVVWILCVISTGLHKFDWAQVAWINPLNTFFNFFARALMTGPTRTWIKSEYASFHVLITVLSSISSEKERDKNCYLLYEK